jgi:hypothetical protein
MLFIPCIHQVPIVFLHTIHSCVILNIAGTREMRSLRRVGCIILWQLRLIMKAQKAMIVIFVLSCLASERIAYGV